MRFLKADTEVVVRIGPCIDITDGFTCLATLDASTADYAYLSENGGAETSIAANTWAAVGSVTGWYDLTLTAAQLDTEGPTSVMIYDVSLCLPIFAHFMVVNANVYDSLFAAATTDYLQTDVTQAAGTAWASGAITAGVFAADSIVAATLATGALTADAFAANAIVAATLNADCITAAKIADDTITSDQISANFVTAIWAEIVETNGSRTAQQVQSILLSALAGVTTAAGATLKDPSGTDTRITATINGSNERTAITLAPSS